MSFRFHSAFRETESGLMVPQSLDTEMQVSVGPGSPVQPAPEVKLAMTDKAKQAALDLLKTPPQVQTPARPRQSGDKARRPPQHSRMFMGMGNAANKPRHNRKRAKRDPRRRKA